MSESIKGTYITCGEPQHLPLQLPRRSGSHEGPQTCRHENSSVRRERQGRREPSGYREWGQGQRARVLPLPKRERGWKVVTNHLDSNSRITT